MGNPFQYRAPTEDEAEVMATIADKLADVYAYVEIALPSTAERTLAIRKLQEARMWFNAGIVLNRPLMEHLA